MVTQSVGPSRRPVVVTNSCGELSTIFIGYSSGLLDCTAN
jgi:hypothetical protein